MPKTYYSKTLMASQVDQRVLKDLLAMKCPRLATHLDAHGIDIGLITFNWFLTIFVDNVPFETVLLVWDSFLYEGCKVLFRFALAVFRLNEESLLQIDDTSLIFQQMREMAANISDNRSLSQTAFPGLNPFPMRVINKQRAHHTAIVKEELAEMESLRNTHQESTFESQRNDPAMIVFSDDDDM
ncbi:TBC1 domain family member 2A-like [Sycon ciliatum]|uniref:TBC1 domain family member 2A-like n=1 Tax=Sycon ciliatum TaxID=27933 RepID=UPI0031F72262